MGIDQQQSINDIVTRDNIISLLRSSRSLSDKINCTEVSRLIYDFISESQKDGEVESLRLKIKVQESALSGNVGKFIKNMRKFIAEQLIDKFITQLVEKYTTEEQRRAFIQEVCEIVLEDPLPLPKVAERFSQILNKEYVTEKQNVTTEEQQATAVNDNKISQETTTQMSIVGTNEEHVTKNYGKTLQEVTTQISVSKGQITEEQNVTIEVSQVVGGQNITTKVPRITEVSSDQMLQETTTHVVQSTVMPLEQLNLELMNAVKQWDFDKVREYINKGANVDAKDSDGNTPLHIAVEEGLFGIVEYLVNKNADINAKGKNESTPLYLATYKDRLNIVEFLLDRGADANIGSDLRTPLHTAVQWGDLDLVRLLLDKGANVNIYERYDGTPLHVAVKKRRLDVAELLLDRGADINAKNYYVEVPLYIAIEQEVQEMVRLLVSKGANLNINKRNGNALLSLALNNNKLDVVKFLISKGADVNVKGDSGDTLLHSAVQQNKLDLVRFLIDNGADVNTRNEEGSTPFHLAITKGMLDLAGLLIENGANINAKDNHGETPLHLTVVEDNLDKVKYLISKGVDVNTEDSNGLTPLLTAVKYMYIMYIMYIYKSVSRSSYDSIVKYLINGGADVNVKDATYDTPLHLATKACKLEIIKLLVDKGANIMAKNRDNSMPIHLAPSSTCKEGGGYLEIIKFFLDRGIDINVRGNDNHTLLREVCRGGDGGGYRDGGKVQEDTIKFLIEKGANISPTEDNDWSLLHWAAAVGNLDIVKLVVNKGFDVNYLTEGDTALYEAAQNGHLCTVKFLLDKGARTDIKGGNTFIVYGILKRIEDTALHAAVRWHRFDVAKLLIERGADLNAQDSNGNTPRDLLNNSQNPDAVAFLTYLQEYTQRNSHNRKRRNTESKSQMVNLGDNLSQENNIPAVTSAAGKSISWISSIFWFMKNSIRNIAADIVNYTASQSQLRKVYLSSYTNKQEGLQEQLKEELFYLNKKQFKSLQEVTQPFELDQILLLLTTFVCKLTKNKFIHTESTHTNVSYEKVTVHAVSIISKFEKLLKTAANKSGISVKNLNFNPMELQSKVTRKILSGNFNELIDVLYRAAQDACPDFKQTEKFLSRVAEGISWLINDNKTINRISDERKGVTMCCNSNEQLRSLLIGVSVEPIGIEKKQL